MTQFALPAEERIIAAVLRRRHTLDDIGICLSCEADCYGVEPDARHIECEACGEPQVFGAEELLTMLVGLP